MANEVPMTDESAVGWLLYRQFIDGEVEFYGIYETEEAARRQVDLLRLNGERWDCDPVKRRG
jgi:hypothetical protein